MGLNTEKRVSTKTQIMQGFDAHGGIQSITVEVDNNNVDWLNAILPLDSPVSAKKFKSSDPKVASNGGARSSSNNNSINHKKNTTNKTTSKKGSRRKHRKAQVVQSLKKNAKPPSAPQQRGRRIMKSRAAKNNVSYIKVERRSRK